MRLGACKSIYYPLYNDFYAISRTYITVCFLYWI